MRNQELRPNLFLIINSIRKFSINHHLVRIGKMYNLRKIIRIEININQLFRIRSITNDMCTFRTRRNTSSSALANFLTFCGPVILYCKFFHCFFAFKLFIR